MKLIIGVLEKKMFVLKTHVHLDYSFGINTNLTFKYKVKLISLIKLVINEEILMVLLLL